MKKSLFIAWLAMGLASSTFAQAITLEPVADTWVQNGNIADNSKTDLRVKNQNNQVNDRVSFLRFDGSAIRNNVAQPTLSLTVASYSGAPSTLTLQLFGIPDGAATEGFDPATLTFANSGFTDQSADNNVNDALFWGGAPVATLTLRNTDVAGTTVTFSGATLAAFLNANANDHVTFAVTSATINDGMFLAFAGLENTTHAHPTLSYELPPAIPEIVLDPVSQTNYAGASVQLTGGAIGIGPLEYQWKAGAIGSGTYTNLIGGSGITGVNSNVLVINPAVVSHTADYVLAVTNAGGWDISAPATLRVDTAFVTGASPAVSTVYPGANVQFSVSATGATPITYQWRKGGSALADGANLSGVTTATLSISNVSSGDVANYDVVVTTPYGSVTSAAGTLALTDAPTVGSYAERVFTNRPVAYWRLNETSGTDAYDFAGGHTAKYGDMAVLGASGPADPFFPRFEASNTGFTSTYGVTNSSAVMPAGTALGINTNTLTITAWIYPVNSLMPNSGIVMHREANNAVAGLHISSAGYLGYTWNNDSGTYGWNSQLLPPTDQWSFVAVTITPTNATLYLYNSFGQLTAQQTRNHANATFNGAIHIGDDPLAGSNGGRAFSGSIDEVAIFARSLSSVEVSSLYYTALGQDQYPPAISAQPVSLMLYAQQTAQFSVQASAFPAPTYQWKKWDNNIGNYTILADGGRVSGARSPMLTISNLVEGDSADYIVTVANSLASVDSLTGNLYVMPVGPAETITMSVVQTSGQSWETAESWSDFLSASNSAVAKPGSTYQILPGAAMRTPYNVASTAFPGNELRVQGNGVFATTIASSGIGALILKPSNWGMVTFNRLVMEGGEILNFVDGGGSAAIAGEIQVTANTPIYSADDTSERSIRIDAKLTGNGSIEYRGHPGTAFRPAALCSLNIAGTNNTYTGTWNVMAGTLVGSFPGSLGTNGIVVGAAGALQTSYDLNNPQGTLVLYGRYNLTGNATFKSAVVSGVPLEPGTHTYAQLSTMFPTNFPANWNPQPGAEAVTNATGSITVLQAAAPVIVTQPVASQTLYVGQSVSISVVASGGGTLSYEWMYSNGGAFVPVVNGSRIAGADTATLSISTLAQADAGDYRVIVTNPSGSVTSSSSQLTVQPTLPAETITMSVLETAGQDWNTAVNWSDGMAASVSAVAKPGSTYKVLANAGLRTPAEPATATFPGEQLIVEGNGVLSSTLGAGDIGSLMLKGASSGSTVYFKKLVMAGGQLVNVVNSGGSATLTGELNVAGNMPVWAADDTRARTIHIQSTLTGSGSIEYRAYVTSTSFQPTNVASLNIAGANNTYSGTWNVVLGTLVGSGANALGTNTITVGAEGALQATYNINNPKADLVLDGRLYLTGNHTFRSVIIDGTPLAAGVWTFADLATAYPAHFPASWVGQPGAETLTTANGTLSVGGAIARPSLGFGYSSSGLVLEWTQGQLLEAPTPSGPWTTNTTATSPLVVTPAGPQMYFRLQVQ